MARRNGFVPYLDPSTDAGAAQAARRHFYARERALDDDEPGLAAMHDVELREYQERYQDPVRYVDG